MASYQVVTTTNLVIPEGYDKGYSSISSLANPIHWDRTSSSHQYAQPVEQPGSYFEDSDTVPQYPRGTRYGPAFNDPPSYLPDLTKSPSISSGSSIGTPYGRSYQERTGSYFPPSRKNTGPYPMNPIYAEESDSVYPGVDDNDNELEHVGSAFADVTLEDRYSGRMGADLYEDPDSGYERSRSKPKELSKKEREEISNRNVDDLFDKAEKLVTFEDWNENIGPRPGIATHFTEVQKAVTVIRESERINKDLKGISIILASFRRLRKHRPSFSSGKSTFSSKHQPASKRDIYHDNVKPSKSHRNRDGHRW